MIIRRIFSFTFALIIWLLELVARALWLLTPIGIHMLFLQLRQNVDKLPALTGYFDPDSTWQMIYDGCVIVNTNPGAVRKRANNIKNWFVKTKWFWLTLAIGLIVAASVASVYLIAYKLY